MTQERVFLNENDVYVSNTKVAVLASFGGFDSNGPGVMGVIVAIAILAAGILWFRSLRPTFHVVLASAAAERQGLTSKDESLVDRITAAINDAITHRG